MTRHDDRYWILPKRLGDIPRQIAIAETFGQTPPADPLGGVGDAAHPAQESAQEEVGAGHPGD